MWTSARDARAREEEIVGRDHGNVRLGGSLRRQPCFARPYTPRPRREKARRCGSGRWRSAGLEPLEPKGKVRRPRSDGSWSSARPRAPPLIGIVAGSMKVVRSTAATRMFLMYRCALGWRLAANGAKVPDRLASCSRSWQRHLEAARPLRACGQSSRAAPASICRTLPALPCPGGWPPRRKKMSAIFDPPPRRGRRTAPRGRSAQRPLRPKKSGRLPVSPSHQQAGTVGRLEPAA